MNGKILSEVKSQTLVWLVLVFLVLPSRVVSFYHEETARYNFMSNVAVSCFLRCRIGDFHEFI